MYTETAGLYDAIYGAMKDHADDARQIAALIRAVQPAARTVLDVACGTGDHARQLTELGLVVDGVDLDLTGPDGTREVSEVHERGLFSVAQMQAAFAAAGLTASYAPGAGPAHRGQYTARAT
ncbi:MAG TPA: hypothetical protein VGC42_18325 [Kofleriaceae bacterium]